MSAALWLARLNVAVPPVVPLDPWVGLMAWLGQSVPAGALLNAGGLSALVILFATDRIMTKGQHERRVADSQKAHDAIVENLQTAHAAALAELTAHYVTLSGVKDAAYAELKESRDYYRAARLEEKDRADKVTTQLAEGYDEYGRLATHLLGSFTDLAKGETR